MKWNLFFDFLGHGGFKLLIIAFIIVSQILKNRQKKAREERPEMALLPNAMPSQMQTLSSPSGQKANELGSPWSSSSNPFDGAKQ